VIFLLVVVMNSSPELKLLNGRNTKCVPKKAQISELLVVSLGTTIESSFRRHKLEYELTQFCHTQAMGRHFSITPAVFCATLLLLTAHRIEADVNITGCPTLNEEASSFAIPFPMDFIIIVILVCFSALFSGLTLGLLGLDKIGLEIIIAGDDPELAKCARSIAPVRANGNLLLCTLLLGNVAVNALLSILMANMTSGLVGFLVSTFMIVIFGEIIPQATCSRYALQIGSRSLPIVKVFIYALYIICKPLSMILDKALGEEIGTIHSRTELRKMLEIHVKHKAVDVESGKVMDGYVLFFFSICRLFD
jgi:hypothetical protein